MITHHSPPATAADRGYAFGERFADKINSNVEFYRRLFAAVGDIDDNTLARWGGEALQSTHRWAPAIADEIEGIAAGAGLKPQLLGALNARTEILGCCRRSAKECSVAVLLGPEGVDPVAVQTWDWHDDIERGWLVWTIEHPSGHIVHTLTEYGIVGKIGVSTAGIGLLLNILRHASDGERIGTPVHVIARRLLDEAIDINQALLLISDARPSASSAMTVIAVNDGEKTALTVEVWPDGPSHVLPDREGTLIHTNHFLDARAAVGDLEPVLGPDSFVRYEILQRRIAQLDSPSQDSVIAAMHSHLGSTGAVCCHPAADAQLGDRYTTLATVALDVQHGRLKARSGGPCATEPVILEAGERMPLQTT